MRLTSPGNFKSVRRSYQLDCKVIFIEGDKFSASGHEEFLRTLCSAALRDEDTKDYKVTFMEELKVLASGHAEF
jgi:hypothetical protein